MDDRPQPASRPDGAHQSGESGGGPYPNPHSGRENSNFKGGDFEPQLLRRNPGRCGERERRY